MSGREKTQREKDLNRVSQDFAKQSYYCPYCKGTNAVGAQHQRKLLKEGKKLICYHCHRGFSIEGMKTVYEIAQVTFLKQQYKRFLNKHNNDNN